MILEDLQEMNKFVLISPQAINAINPDLINGAIPDLVDHGCVIFTILAAAAINIKENIFLHYAGCQERIDLQLRVLVVRTDADISSGHVITALSGL